MLLLLIPIGKAILQQVILAVGAGIYEEFLFRVLLISGLSSILGFVFLWKKKGSNISVSTGSYYVVISLLPIEMRKRYLTQPSLFSEKALMMIILCYDDLMI